VIAVTNRIEVVPPPVAAADLRKSIQGALERQAERETRQIDLDVHGGTSHCAVSCTRCASAMQCSVPSRARPVCAWWRAACISIRTLLEARTATLAETGCSLGVAQYSAR
jgi:hypothetical protein